MTDCTDLRKAPPSYPCDPCHPWLEQSAPRTATSFVTPRPLSPPLLARRLRRRWIRRRVVSRLLDSSRLLMARDDADFEEAWQIVQALCGALLEHLAIDLAQRQLEID